MVVNAMAANVKEEDGKLKLVPDAKTTISLVSGPNRISRDKFKEDISRKNDRYIEPIISTAESEVIAIPNSTLDEENDLII